MKPKLDPEEQEHAQLSWKLIGWKVAYYMPEAVHASRREDYEVNDATYDEAEQRYLWLCRKLGNRNTLVHKGYPGFEDLGTEFAMFEVDVTRPSVQLVMGKMCSRRLRSYSRK